MNAERDINPGGAAILLAALVEISEMPPQLNVAQLVDQFVDIRLLAKRAIAKATMPADCPGVIGRPFTHLFVGDPPHCARCGLAEAAWVTA